MSARAGVSGISFLKLMWLLVEFIPCTYRLHGGLFFKVIHQKKGSLISSPVFKGPTLIRSYPGKLISIFINSESIDWEPNHWNAIPSYSLILSTLKRRGLNNTCTPGGAVLESILEFCFSQQACILWAYIHYYSFIYAFNSSHCFLFIVINPVQNNFALLKFQLVFQ